MRPHSLPRGKRRRACLSAAALLLAGCSSPRVDAPAASVSTPDSTSSTSARPSTVIVSLVGISDLHGHVETTPLLGGYIANLRAARAKDGGVLLVDAGDMFQGTLESNLGEGRAVLHAYAALGVDAAAIGNHEFDYGPVGPKATATDPGDDPRGALLARIQEASFPMLSANVNLQKTRGRAPLGKPHVVVEVAGVRIGIVGVTASNTLTTTASANVSDLAIAPLAATIEAEARALRGGEHADAVVVLAHAGGKCKGFRKGPDADQCEDDAEIFSVARALPAGVVDAIVAGHTHQGVAETVNAIPIIESWAYGRAFGRIDLTFEREGKGERAALEHTEMFDPQDLCPNAKAFDPSCTPATYEGSVPTPSTAVAAAIAPDLAAAKERREELLGPSLKGKVHRDYDHESEEGNLFVDLLREAYPKATVVMMNGGGLRDDLPAGPLAYGALFEAFPFDNKVGTATITGADLVRILTDHMKSKGGVLSVGGVRVKASCRGSDVRVDVIYDDGKPVRDADAITLLASDFMLTGGDAFWGAVTPPKVELQEVFIRDVLEAGLRKRSAIDPKSLVDATKPRMDFPGIRPVKCP